jgi:hypothetical protein
MLRSVVYRFVRIHHPKIDDRIHLDGHVVLRDDVLRRHIQRDRPQADAQHPVDGKEDELQSRPRRLRQQTPEPENDAALVFVQDLDAVQDPEKPDDDGKRQPTEQQWHRRPP